EHTYGPIGTIFALLSYLIAIGVVVILGAVVGRAWHERSPGTSETSQLPPSCHPQLPPHAPVQGPAEGHMSLPNSGQVGTAEHEGARRSLLSAAAGGSLRRSSWGPGTCSSHYRSVQAKNAQCLICSPHPGSPQMHPSRHNRTICYIPQDQSST